MTTPAHDINPAEVQVGTANGPGLYIAPVGTLGPADTSAAWPPEWDILGYLSDDGPTVGTSTDTEDIKPWQSVAPIRSVITGRTMTLQFVLWQLNELTLGVYFDCDPAVPDAGTGAVKMAVRTDTPQHLYALGLDTADGDRAMRIIFHRASLSDAGDMQIQRGAAVPLDCTLTALDDAGILADILLGPTTAAGGASAPAGSAAANAGAAAAVRGGVPLVGAGAGAVK